MILNQLYQVRFVLIAELFDLAITCPCPLINNLIVIRHDKNVFKFFSG